MRVGAIAATDLPSERFPAAWTRTEVYKCIGNKRHCENRLKIMCHRELMCEAMLLQGAHGEGH